MESNDFWFNKRVLFKHEMNDGVFLVFLTYEGEQKTTYEGEQKTTYGIFPKKSK